VPVALTLLLLLLHWFY